MNKYAKLAAATAVAVSVGAGMSIAAKADTAVVKMKFDEDSGDLYFEPAKITINPGDTVVWLQDDADNEHNVAAYPSFIPEGTEPFESQMMTRVGESWSMTFVKEGSYFYHCHPHEGAGMKGLIVVGRESLPEEFRKATPGDMTHDHGDGGHGDTADDDMADMKHSDHGDHGDHNDHGDHHGHDDKQEMKKKDGHHDDDNHHGHHD